MNDTLSEFWRTTWLAWQSGLLSPVNPRFENAADGEYEDFVKNSADFKSPDIRAFFSSHTPSSGEFLVGFVKSEDQPALVQTNYRLWLFDKHNHEYVFHFGVLEGVIVENTGASAKVTIKYKDDSEKVVENLLATPREAFIQLAIDWCNNDNYGDNESNKNLNTEAPQHHGDMTKCHSPVNFVSPPRFSYRHEWLRFKSEDNVEVGITERAVRGASKFYCLSLPTIGQMLNAGEACAIVGTPSGNETFNVLAPISGKVLATNDALLDQTGATVGEPFQDAPWLIRIAPTNLDTEHKLLLSRKRYRAHKTSQPILQYSIGQVCISIAVVYSLLYIGDKMNLLDNQFFSVFWLSVATLTLGPWLLLLSRLGFNHINRDILNGLFPYIGLYRGGVVDPTYEDIEWFNAKPIWKRFAILQYWALKNSMVVIVGFISILLLYYSGYLLLHIIRGIGHP